MNVFTELSQKNTYQPNLTSTQESCERTYRQAIRKLDKITQYYSNIDLSNLSSEDIYDACCEAAADLALCCELFLKSIYIYENGLKGTNIDVMWNNLARPQVKDQNGNDMYINNGVISMLRVDNDGNPILDENGNRTYIDESGNILRNGQQGKRIQKSGHDLEHLITTVISDESRMLLDIMMTANLMEETDRHTKVDLIDILTSKGAVESERKMTESQYRGWLNQHAVTFVDARYAGQSYHNIEVAFLFHLATQCKALAQYVIEPDKKENVNLTEEEIENIPNVISKVAAISKRLVTQDLIKLVIHDDKKRKKLEGISQPGIIELFLTAKPSHFYSLVSDFEIDEIAFVCESMSKCSRKKQYNGNANDSFELLLSMIKPKEFLATCVYLKTLTKYKINKELMTLLIEKILDKMTFENNYKDAITYNKYEYDIPKDFNIINKNYKF